MLSSILSETLAPLISISVRNIALLICHRVRSFVHLGLMHWPAPMVGSGADKTVDWLDTWKSMEKLYEANPDKIKAIGVSFSWSLRAVLIS
jgi:hypothetical protein